MNTKFYTAIALFATAGIMSFFTSCEKETVKAVPIAPILKEVVIPSGDAVIPGGNLKIAGLGFSSQDQVYLTDESGERHEVSVVAADDYSITIMVPVELGGNYKITIGRNGKETTLEGVLQVPLIVVLDNVVMPAEVLAAGKKANIKGEGFQEGDKLKFIAPHYPEGMSFETTVELNNDGISFILPEKVYGTNTVIVYRDDRQTNLGTLSIAAEIGAAIGGGIVYWLDEQKIHGYICNMTSVGTATEKFGPEVTEANASGTSEKMGSGKQNTISIINQFEALQTANHWPEWVDVKIAAQLCTDNVVEDGKYKYKDWFLPSREELIEVFKAKDMLKEKGVNIPYNNYWTSSEAPSPNPGWAAYYVNFYEPEKLVSEICSKSGWTIGVLPVRSF